MNTSQIENPVSYIWYWLSSDNGIEGEGCVRNCDLPRKDVIEALTAQGIAAGTISVQRHKFLKASEAERVARASRVVVKS